MESPSQKPFTQVWQKMQDLCDGVSPLTFCLFHSTLTSIPQYTVPHSKPNKIRLQNLRRSMKRFKSQKEISKTAKIAKTMTWFATPSLQKKNTIQSTVEVSALTFFFPPGLQVVLFFSSLACPATYFSKQLI